MRCLEKDRERRYESAGGLARDIERSLCDEPVEARPPSVPYRVRKYAKRHRVALATTAIVLVSTLAGLAAAFSYARKATLATRAADVARDVAEQRATEANKPEPGRLRYATRRR